MQTDLYGDKTTTKKPKPKAVKRRHANDVWCERGWSCCASNFDWNRKHNDDELVEETSPSAYICYVHFLTLVVEPDLLITDYHCSTVDVVLEVALYSVQQDFCDGYAWLGSIEPEDNEIVAGLIESGLSQKHLCVSSVKSEEYLLDMKIWFWRSAKYSITITTYSRQ